MITYKNARQNNKNVALREGNRIDVHVYKSSLS